MLASVSARVCVHSNYAADRRRGRSAGGLPSPHHAEESFGTLDGHNVCYGCVIF